MVLEIAVGVKKSISKLLPQEVGCLLLRRHKGSAEGTAAPQP